MLDGEIKLVESAVRGKASAFGLLYDHYQPKIYRFILIKTGKREDAEDITHQVFLNAWQNISGYKDLGFPFSSWLYRIAKNQVIDRYRTAKQDVSLEAVDYERSTDSETDERAIEIKMQLERVMKAVATLKQDYQDIVIMRFVEDLSVKEVASAVEKSEGAVKLMQHRAIKELKKILGEKNGNN